ncbi:MAG: hypothetical protein ACT4OX_03480 [Actinomycetota bacterium]
MARRAAGYRPGFVTEDAKETVEWVWTWWRLELGLLGAGTVVVGIVRQL